MSNSSFYYAQEIDYDNAPEPGEALQLWEGIVETLREFPRTIDTIQFGLDRYFNWDIPVDVISAELLKLASAGFVELTDSHTDALCGYKLTRDGLLLQAGDTELCPHCGVELVIGCSDGWRKCGSCGIRFLMWSSDSDETSYHLYRYHTARTMLGRSCPGVPKEIRRCLPIPTR